MMPKRAVLIVGMAFLAAPMAAFAHHALESQFDTTKTVSLTGSVRKIDWSNPHVRLYLDVQNASTDVIWEVEMGSPNLEFMNGWKIDTYRRGDRVRVDAYPARNGSNMVYGKKVSRAIP